MVPEKKTYNTLYNKHKNKSKTYLERLKIPSEAYKS